jgi:hypothetical protein
MVGPLAWALNGKSAGHLWDVNKDLLLQLRVLRLGLLQDGDGERTNSSRAKGAPVKHQFVWQEATAQLNFAHFEGAAGILWLRTATGGTREYGAA